MYFKLNHLLHKLAELSLKKRDLLQSKYPNINLSLLEQCDPTPTSEYINWLIKLYLNKTIILPEDQDKIYSALKRYTLGKKENRFPQQHKDINAFKSYGELAQIIDQYLGTDLEDIKVMTGYNNSKILFNNNGYEVIYVNDINDLVNLSQGTRWCTRDQERAEIYIKKGPLYLINRNNQRYCLVHPATNQMKDVYDSEFRGKEEKEILDLLTHNNIIPIDDIITIIVRRRYLNEKGYEKYRGIVLEKGKRNSDIAYVLISNYKNELNDEQKNIYVQSAIKKGDNAYKLLIEYNIITREDGQLFFDLRKQFITKEYLQDSYNTYDLLFNRIITREDGQLFFDCINKALEYSYNAYGLLINNIITREDGKLFIDCAIKAIENSYNAYDLLKDRIITIENGQLFIDCVNKAIEKNYSVYDLLVEKIITKEYFQIAKGPNLNQQFQENIEQTNQEQNQPIANVINKLIKQSQLLKEKEKIDYDIVLDIATEVFNNIKENVFETTIIDSHVIKGNLIYLSISILGRGFNGKLIQTNKGFKIIIGNIHKHLSDHEMLLKFIYSVLVHEITHISDILNNKYLNEEPEDLKEYVNSENERIAYTNQIIRECISYMNDLSPKLLAERIRLNDGKNDFIINEILESSETFMEIKNIIKNSFMSQLKKSIKYLLYKFIET